MLERLAVLVLGLTLVQAGLESEWAQYKKDHGKVYNSRLENDFRRNIWQKNLVKITSHNVKFYKGESSYMLGTSKFTDMTSAELKKYRMQKIRVSKDDVEVREDSLKIESHLPKEVDWRKKGYVTPVKDQGSCGSCWAFSATGTMEGQHFKASKKLVSLSESNLVDCCPTSRGCYGCVGSIPYRAVQFVIDNKGIDTEKSYPYNMFKNECTFKKAGVGATFSSYVNITSGSEKALQRAAAEIGPISVGIQTGDHFDHYKSGVYDEPSCTGQELDHAVLVVGYGKEDGKDYWLVKNSWGKKWGDKGYIKMRRNRHNQCGISNVAMYPVV